MTLRHRLLLFSLVASSASVPAEPPQGSGRSPLGPTCEGIEVTLTPGSENCIPGVADGNVPVHWVKDAGLTKATAFVRVDTDCCDSNCYRQARIHGASLTDLFRATPREVVLPQLGTWRGIESTWLGLDTDDDDPQPTLYAFYHEEPPGECGPVAVLGSIPIIGMAKSRDDGRTWSDLGTILRAPTGTSIWNGPNVFFCGGYGDFSAVLDHESRHFYIFFSSYRRMRDFENGPVQQGVAMARLPFPARDVPRGQVEIWDGEQWARHDPDSEGYHRVGPIFPASRDWHAVCEEKLCAIPACDLGKASPRHAACPASGGCSDALWGPAVHWNAGVGRWVLLMNRTCSPCWSTEGHYVSFNADLSDPRGWCPPRRIDQVNEWYPQVLPQSAGETDTRVGQRARYMVGGEWCGEIEIRRVVPAK